MQKVIVRYLSLPDIENGVSGFYEYYHYNRCTEPSEPYKNGRCHTTGADIDGLAKKAGFVTRKEYAAERKRQKYTSWKNAYGSKLSLAVGETLEKDGIVWNINGNDILFRCPKGEYVGWPWKKYLE